MKKAYLFEFALLAAASASAAYPVSPFIGTSATGHTFPGACVPFGMVQASPDTGNESWDYCGGYRHDDKAIFGFSQTHLNGTGCPELGDILVLPFTGELPADGRVAIDKATEQAEPGRYSVTLPDVGVKAEVTAAEHVAVYRFRYSKGPAKLLVDCNWGLTFPGTLGKYVVKGTAKTDQSGNISGWRQTRGWNERTLGYCVVFSHRPAGSATGDNRRFVLQFDLKPDEELIVKIGLSRESAEQARRNLSEEIPGKFVQSVGILARAAWNDVFGLAEIEGTDEQKLNWYTALYHLCIQPNNIADAGKTPYYSTFSCWDTFRAAGPLYTILMPERAAAFVDSMLRQGRETGYLPIWTLWGGDNQCMIGTHSVPMIVDAILKGVWKGDEAAAYAQIKDSLTVAHPGRQKENWDLLDKYGYYPFDVIRGESVSRTMECAYDDWCAAQLAKRLGHEGDGDFFLRRSRNWRNVFDPSLGVVRGKDSQGRWREPFDPYALGHGAGADNDFTEGNAFQYTWHVMQDPYGLIAALGGRKRFTERLDRLFTLPSETKGMGHVADVTGLIGQYVHGNEPSHHVIYFYPFLDRADSAAERIRDVFDRFYLPKPDGLCGNDDCGQMSAWYIFSAMGFYPFNPCGGEYVIGAPQVPKVTLRLAGGKTFVITAKGLSKANKYVKSVMLNGKSLPGFILRHAEIMAGGTLEFEMVGK